MRVPVRILVYLCLIYRLTIIEKKSCFSIRSLNTQAILKSSNQKSNSPNYWNDLNNQKQFMMKAAKLLNIVEMDDWYKVTHKDFIKLGAGSLINNQYQGSSYNLLSQIFPDFTWLPWKFNKCPANYWDDLKNQRTFLDWLSVQLKIKDMSDWYNVTGKDFEGFGESLLIKYNGSISLLLSSVYTEYAWLPWLFVKCPVNYFDDNKNKRKFLDWAGKELGIKDLSDWYNVTAKDVLELAGKSAMRKSLFTRKFSLEELLERAYPEFSWNFPIKNKYIKKSQFLLKKTLKSLFPQEDILEEYRHPNIQVETGSPLELDFFLPKLQIAVEYQGIQHYSNVPVFHRLSNQEELKSRDVRKSELCKQHGISLIEVPFWWDRKSSSLEATIYKQRPELFAKPPNGAPIPSQAPEKLAKPKHVNSMMTATLWEESMNPTGWFMTEKYDGMRVFWTGTEFVTRNGKILKVPNFITEKMPKMSLDCEVWTQYGLYQEAVALAKEGDEEKWKKAVFWIFDAPSLANKPFEERIAFLNDLKARESLPGFMRVVEIYKCKGKEHLQEFFESIITRGGEGVMLREPGSLYKIGRSDSLRKFKPFFDTEVKIIRNNYPHGLDCVQINGKNLFVGIENNIGAKELKEGSVITVKHQGTNVYGTLQYPKFYRERKDLKWEELINL